MEKVLAIPIPINELKKYAILSPILSPILFSFKLTDHSLMQHIKLTIEDFGAF